MRLGVYIREGAESEEGEYRKGKCHGKRTAYDQR